MQQGVDFVESIHRVRHFSIPQLGHGSGSFRSMLLPESSGFSSQTSC